VLLQVVVPLAFVIARSGVGASMGPVYYDPAFAEELLTSAQGYVSGLAARLQRNGINAEGRVVEGQDVLMTITETTDQVDPDLIVMSTHALTGAARAVLGSVSDGVVRTTGHPVLLVRQETAARLLEPEAPHNADNPDSAGHVGATSSGHGPSGSVLPAGKPGPLSPVSAGARASTPIRTPVPGGGAVSQREVCPCIRVVTKLTMLTDLASRSKARRRFVRAAGQRTCSLARLPSAGPDLAARDRPSDSMPMPERAASR
jgi:nucleotide-binding universal stress UspA family protein